MVELLMLKDNVDAIFKNQNVLSLPALEANTEQTTTQTVHTAHTSTDGNTISSPQTDQMSQAVDTNAVSDTTNTELLVLLISYEELGRKQSIMVPATQSPQYSPLLPAQASKFNTDLSNNNPPSQPVAQPVREGMISLRDLSYLQKSLKCKGW